MKLKGIQMADVNNIPAESSSAPTSSEVLASMTADQRGEWRATGKVPEQPNKQEAAPADTPKETTTEHALEAESGKHTQEPKEKKAKSETVPYDRFSEVVAERNRYREELEAERKQKAAPAEAKKVEEPAKKAEAPKLLTQDEYFTKNPDATFEEYIDYRAKETAKQLRAEEKEADAKAETERKQKEQTESLEKSWNEKVKASVKAHEDFTKVVTKEFNDSIPPGSVLDGWLIESEQGAEILYHLAANPDEMTSLLELKTPFAQARRLAKLEDQLAGEPVEKKEKEAPAPQQTKAPKPVSEVGGRGTAPEDAAAAAAKEGNYRAFKEEQNRKDLARLKS